MDVTKFINNEEIVDWYKVSDSNVEIKIKQIPPKKMDMFRKQCLVIINPGRSMAKEVNEDKLNDMLLHEAVVEWKNIEMGGKPLPCNRENKIALDGSWTPFHELWNQVVTNPKNMEALRVEEDLKN